MVIKQKHYSHKYTKRSPAKLIFMPEGFSLVEIIVVMVIIAIMAFFAAPSLINFRPNMRLKGAARDLHTNLQLMKVEAIKSNKDVLITFINPAACPAYPSSTVPSPGGRYTINVDNDNDGTVSAGDTAFNMDDSSGDATPDGDYDFPQDTALCQNGSLPAGNTLFKFSPRGFWLDSTGNLLGSPTVFQVQNNKGSGFTVTVSVAGGISTVKLP